jgi:hypothetical protein
LKKINLLTEITRSYSISKNKNQLSFFLQKKLIIPRKSERSKEEIKSKKREIRSVNSSNTLYLQVQEIQKNKSIVRVMRIQKDI